MAGKDTVRESIEKILAEAGKQGIHQSILEHALGYSKSYLSETLAQMEEQGLIMRRLDVGRNNRIWLASRYPGEVTGILKVGLLRSSEYYPHLSAISNIAKKNDLKVAVTAYNKANEILADLVEGVLDFGFAPVISTLLSSYASMVNAISETASGGSYIFENTKSKVEMLVSSELSSMSLLSSRFLANHEGTTTEYFTSPGEAVRVFLSGAYRYIAIWEPYASKISGKKGVRPIMTYHDALADLPCCLLVRRKDVSSDRERICSELKGEIKKVVSADVKMIAQAKDSQLTAILNQPDDVIDRSLRNYRFKHSCSFQNLEKIAHLTGITISHSLIEQMIS